MTEAKAAELQTLRSGSRVLGISADVRDYSALVAAVERTVEELGRLDYVMCVCSSWHFPSWGGGGQLLTGRMGE